jgi:hypothetical protein
MLTLANTLWANGHVYTAVILYLPVQVASVLAQNSTVLLALILGVNAERIGGIKCSRKF